MADKAERWLTQQILAHLSSPLKIRRFEADSLREMIAVSLKQWALIVPKDRQRLCRVLQNLYRL
jgi:hypothetical protein